MTDMASEENDQNAAGNAVQLSLAAGERVSSAGLVSSKERGQFCRLLQPSKTPRPGIPE